MKKYSISSSVRCWLFTYSANTRVPFYCYIIILQLFIHIIYFITLELFMHILHTITLELFIHEQNKTESIQRNFPTLDITHWTRVIFCLTI